MKTKEVTIIREKLKPDMEAFWAFTTSSLITIGATTIAFSSSISFGEHFVPLLAYLFLFPIVIGFVFSCLFAKTEDFEETVKVKVGK